MAIRDMILPEFDMEVANTRKILERLPDDKFDWQPHPKSMKLGALAGHLIDVLGWTVETLTQDGYDVGASDMKMPEPPKNRQEALDRFEKTVIKARAALAAVTDEALMLPWSMHKGEQVFFTMPRIAVLRGFVLNHSIHHRAQLGVDLRLNDVPLPNIYGPTADEPMM